MTTFWNRNATIEKTSLVIFRGGYRTAATFKMERFVMIVNGWKPLTVITKRSILDDAAAPDPPLLLVILLSNLDIA